MSDDVTPEPRDAVEPVSPGEADTSAQPQEPAPRVSLTKDDTAAPADATSAAGDPAEGTPAGNPADATPAAGSPADAVDTGKPAAWAAPDASGPQGPGYTVGDGVPSPGTPSVHDQQTIASMPGAPEGTGPADPGTAHPNGVGGNPFAPPTPDAPGTGNPFAPPTPTPAAGPGNPFAPPASGAVGPAAQAGPFAPPAATPPPGAGMQGNLFAPPGAGEPVPPPPIAPEGPGQLPYGYPVGDYGHPHPYGGAHAPNARPVPVGYYGWPGMVPPPDNGMGTTGLVIGIVSAGIFCLWPLSIILGILAVIFGAVGRSRANQGVATNGGQALAGMICGAAGLVLGVGILVLLITVG
ncbi:hypothetical protein ACFQE4_23520 [Streptomyces thermocoprophilus]|uniref:DUF4190 domain-containing protein n=1 Tax=Streptomyces thermocoprophilus TaxID=78356 RepID=A0ABV5VEI4_9ACTN